MLEFIISGMLFAVAALLVVLNIVMIITGVGACCFVLVLLCKFIIKELENWND